MSDPTLYLDLGCRHLRTCDSAVPVEPIEIGYWCEAEGIYFTDAQEHMTEATYLKRDSGPLGHYGYECEGRRTTLRVGVFEIGGEGERD